MPGTDILLIITIFIITALFLAVYKVLGSIKPNIKDVYDFERDHDAAKPTRANLKVAGEATFIGVTENRKSVFVENNAKHVFVCGTTGSGKTIALSNFLKSGADYDYPMLIVDGKGDTGSGSLLSILNELCPGRKKYIINLNDPAQSDKYNPFKNTNPDVIKDMLINTTALHKSIHQNAYPFFSQ